MSVSQELLKSLFKFDENSGEFIRKVRIGRLKEGSVAGSKRRDGYINLGVNGKSYLLHRLIWMYVHGEFPTKYLDHVDGNPSNNRLCNLREADESENSQNAKKRYTNKSGYTGVHFRPDAGYCARIQLKGKRIHLGYFDTPDEAGKVYQEAAEKLHKDFRRGSQKTEGGKNG